MIVVPESRLRIEPVVRFLRQHGDDQGERRRAGRRPKGDEDGPGGGGLRLRMGNRLGEPTGAEETGMAAGVQMRVPASRRGPRFPYRERMPIG